VAPAADHRLARSNPEVPSALSEQVVSDELQ
jgi:hypothetical protein